MAITDIISEEEIRAPNMEVARGGPEDFMTDDEMDPYQDPEFQQILESLPTKQAEVLMQLIKEFKAMVAQGFTGEFEDFVKMKMSTAQGGPEDFPTEDEMQIGSEELQSIIPMGQQVAQGGRIGYGSGGGPYQDYLQDLNDGIISIDTTFNEWLDNNAPDPDHDLIYAQGGRIGYNSGGDYDAKVKELMAKGLSRELAEILAQTDSENYEVMDKAQGGRIGYQNAGPVGGGIMDVVEQEQVETAPTPQQLIMQWLEARGLPPTPENIQRAIIEMSREGQSPAMTGRSQMETPQMEMPRPPTGGDYVPDELIGQDISEVVTPDVTDIILRQRSEDDVYSDQEMRDMKQDYIDKGGNLDEDKWFDPPEEEKAGIMQRDNPIFYSDDEITYTDEDAIQWRQELDRLREARRGQDPAGYLQLEDIKIKEGVNKGFISEEDYLNKWQMPFFGRRGERKTEEIDRYRDWAFEDDKAQGGRAGYNYGGRARYGLGSLVKSVFKAPAKIIKGVSKGAKGLVKSVKKFAKSDLGKMALMYMATAGMANIGAGGLGGAQSWSSGAWLNPKNVIGFGDPAGGWGNIGKSFTNLGFGAGAPKAAAGTGVPITNMGTGYVPGAAAANPLSMAATGPIVDPLAATGFGTNIGTLSTLDTLAKGKEIADKGGMFSGLLGSFAKNPLPWILGTSAATGLYTKKNPGEDNLDELMRNYKGEVGEWDQMIADIRAGKIQTPFSTSNITYPYPDYMNLAEGGRVAAQEGGLMDLGGLEKDYRADGGFVPIGGKEKADDVPARLSRNEFVFTADAVRNAGGGDVDRGSEVMHNIMTNLEQGGSISEESQGLEGARDMFEVSERLSEVV